MAPRIEPMLHVTDVVATAEWYRNLGFEVLRTASDDDAVTWARLAYGQSSVMLSSGGKQSTDRRRSVDLYIHAEGIAALYEVLKPHAEVIEPPHETFYGQREFILRDCNGFWLTFGEPVDGTT